MTNLLEMPGPKDELAARRERKQAEPLLTAPQGAFFSLYEVEKVLAESSIPEDSVTEILARLEFYDPRPTA